MPFTVPSAAAEGFKLVSCAPGSLRYYTASAAVGQKGDPVFLSSGLLVSCAATAITTCGVALEHWAASATAVLVCTDPDAIYLVKQGDADLAATDVGLYVEHAISTSTTDVSNATIKTATAGAISADAVCQVVGIADIDGNTTDYAFVKLANYELPGTNA